MLVGAVWEGIEKIVPRSIDLREAAMPREESSDCFVRGSNHSPRSRPSGVE